MRSILVGLPTTLDKRFYNHFLALGFHSPFAKITKTLCHFTIRDMGYLGAFVKISPFTNLSKSQFINFCIYVSLFSLHQMVPLHLAAERGHLDIVKYFVSQKADINIKDNNGVNICNYTY